MSNHNKRCSFCCTLAIEKEITVGSPVNVSFTLKNHRDTILYVLSWYTPLEGLAGDIFRITRGDGTEEVPYRGILAKRAQPAIEDYITVEPGKEVSVVVDLSESYDLSKPGRYHLEFKSRLFDVCDKKELIPRKQDGHKAQSIWCNAVEFQIVNKPGND